jgi:hypothetical protein
MHEIKLRSDMDCKTSVVAAVSAAIYGRERVNAPCSACPKLARRGEQRAKTFGVRGLDATPFSPIANECDNSREIVGRQRTKMFSSQSFRNLFANICRRSRNRGLPRSEPAMLIHSLHPFIESNVFGFRLGIVLAFYFQNQMCPRIEAD